MQGEKHEGRWTKIALKPMIFDYPRRIYIYEERKKKHSLDWSSYNLAIMRKLE